MCLHRFVCLTLLTVTLHVQAESDQPTPAKAVEKTKDVQQTLGLQFKLEPVELQVCEELDAAKEHYSRGEWQKTIEQLDAFLLETPNHERTKDALFLRGEAYVQTQAYQKGRADFERLLLLEPNETQSAHARFRIAELTMLLGETAKAKPLLQRFRQFHRSHELNAYALPYLAEIVARSGNFDWARSLYEEVLREFPDGPLYKESLLRSGILAYHQQNYITAAEKLFQLVEANKETDKIEYWTASYWLAMCELRTQREQAAATRFVNLAEAQPQHQFAAASTFRAAEAFRKLNQPEKAILQFLSVRENWPNSKYSLQALLAEMELAKELKQLDRAYELAEALQNFEVTDDGNEGTRSAVQARRLMAEVLLAQEKFDEAIEKVKPLTESRGPITQPVERENHYRDLFLYALAERGLKNFNRATQLLGRIRIDLVQREFGERVLLARAETLNAAKEYSPAVEEGFRYERRFAKGDLIGPVRTQMVIGMLGAHRVDEAMIKFKQLLGTETIPRADAADIAKAARYLGEYLYDHKDYDNARFVFTVLESVHESKDDLARAVSGIAWIEQKAGNQVAAADKFDEFIARFPDHDSITQVRMARAQTLSKSGDRQQAIEALEFFEDLPVENQMRPRGLYQLAELLHHDQASLPRAQQIAERLLKEHPKFAQRDAALYLLGIIRRSQDNPQSKAAFAELVANHRTSRYWSDALYRLAEQARDQRDSDEAKQYLTRLISSERDPQVLPHAIYMKGRIESDARSWSESRETLRKLIRDYPESDLVAVARYGVAESFYQEKNYPRALQLFNILDREKSFQREDAWGAMVQLRRAELLANQQDHVEAIRVAEQIEEKFPDFSLQTEVDYLLGRSYMSRGEFTKAREFYAKIGEANASRGTEVRAMAQWMTGETYFHQKQYILAIKAYEALVADTTFPKWQAASNLQIGKCYELSENFDQAAKYYKRVTERFGDSELAAEAKVRRQVVERKLGNGGG